MFDWFGTMRMADLLPEQMDVTYIFVFTGIAAVYFLIRPLIRWIVVSKSVTLLNYVMSSLLILVFLLGGMVLTTVFQLPLLEVALRSIAVFGGSLGIIHLFQYIFRNRKKRA